MARQTGTGDRRSTSSAMTIGERGNAVSSFSDDRPRIDSDGRHAAPSGEQPPDPRAVIDDLREQLRTEQEKSLNATDAMMGARAIAAQARAETQATFHRLHVREVELEQLKELLDEQPESPDEDQPIDQPEASDSDDHEADQSVSNAARGLLAAIKRAVTE